MTGRTLEEIEAELATKDRAIAHQACLLRVAPDLLAIAQGQREEIARLQGVVATASAKLVEAAEIAASSYREGQQAPVSRKWSEAMNYKLALSICQKAAEMQ